MLNELAIRQIMQLRAQGASAEEIAKELDLEVPLVKLSIARQDESADRDINDDELRLLRQRALDLALQGGDLQVSARMTMFLIERDKPSKNNNGPSSISQINQQIIVARDQFSKLANAFQNTPEESNPAL